MAKFVLLYGCPTTLLSDNASIFTSEFFKYFCSLLEIDKIFSTPHYHQSNACVERSFRTCSLTLRKLSQQSSVEFDELLPYVAWAHNTTVLDTPYALIFGRDPPMAINKCLDRRCNKTFEPSQVEEYKEALITNLRESWKVAHEQATKARLTSKIRSQHRHHPGSVPKMTYYTVVDVTKLSDSPHGHRIIVRPTDLARWPKLYLPIQRADLAEGRRRRMYIRQFPIFRFANTLVAEFQAALDIPSALRVSLALPIMKKVEEGQRASEGISDSAEALDALDDARFRFEATGEADDDQEEDPDDQEEEEASTPDQPTSAALAAPIAA
ncbi:hypothetical protein QR680_016249 [Steinernema hermaphroditum]|uniref:Integrase catalytic domain-containing protein n=1 Tax=Steinernema hermaphroditum TaxID=289476 RepID=A0AA39LLN5_9BILA|nr:hypothetical protein QR680_016249 [Steinernema hermaphroditum]